MCSSFIYSLSTTVKSRVWHILLSLNRHRCWYVCITISHTWPIAQVEKLRGCFWTLHRGHLDKWYYKGKQLWTLIPLQVCNTNILHFTKCNTIKVVPISILYFPITSVISIQNILYNITTLSLLKTLCFHKKKKKPSNDSKASQCFSPCSSHVKCLQCPALSLFIKTQRTLMWSVLSLYYYLIAQAVDTLIALLTILKVYNLICIGIWPCFALFQWITTFYNLHNVYCTNKFT